tara:strand:- start:2027 stop:2353 length:327 start_codon:yes stop_codon:yes gene_type:complete
MKQQRACINCGAPASGASKYCGLPCNKDFNNRRMRRGAQLHDAVMNWRRFRTQPRGKQGMAAVCALASLYIDEDKAAGRNGKYDVPWLTDEEKAKFNNETMDNEQPTA